MRSRSVIVWGLPTLLAAGLVTLRAMAQYAIDWSTADGGGGASTGGVYSVNGTVAQPDAGVPMASGSYSINGGFWVLPQAVQADGAPTLRIECGTPGNAVISWTPAPANWILQERESLTSGSWSNSPSGPTNPVVVPATHPTKFFRLFNVNAAP